MDVTAIDTVSIRPAIDRDLPLLPAIELAAAAQFRQTAYPHMADAPLASEHTDLTQDKVWVANVAGELAGFAIVRAHQDALHIQEIDVDPKFARRGIGAALIRAVNDWARTQRVPNITLTTFDNVPWNGPYYERLGFAILPEVAWTADLQSVRQAEQLAGLPMEHRICMRLAVTRESTTARI